MSPAPAPRSRSTTAIDIASLAAFRIVFGLSMAFAVGRFFWHGWIAEYYYVPKHFFHYYGFAWVRPWPYPFMHVHYALMGLAALGIALGIAYRASAVVFCALFTYAHFIDKTNYLNHYYLVSCLALLMIFLPLDRAASFRVWRRPEEAWDRAPGWALGLVRFQVGLVYVFGGIAKLKKDWLIYGQPLTIWLGANTDFPVIGRWFPYKEFAVGFSWAGALFDLTVVPFLLWRRSRPFAYAAAVAFHLITARLFQLGMFPWIMMGAALVFFDPSWPRRWMERARLLRPASEVPWSPPSMPKWGRVLGALYIGWHILAPLRHMIYPGNVLWTEQGFRFAWNVMLMEKNGAVELTVVEPSTGKRWTVSPLDHLTRYQTKMMSTQPDMILEFAHIVAEDFARKGHPAIEAHVEATVALNARRPQPLIDPRADLVREEDGLGPKAWILPFRDTPPEM
ncbi:HTTM domain-containing protein [Pendulispora albinea]|uniref:HTTM domain-containing protein n=1 Tax=Pendulispora albinea TaxID=2741071 RepID=A0ABZ2M3J1_9BACT